MTRIFYDNCFIHAYWFAISGKSVQNHFEFTRKVRGVELKLQIRILYLNMRFPKQNSSIIGNLLITLIFHDIILFEIVLFLHRFFYGHINAMGWSIIFIKVAIYGLDQHHSLVLLTRHSKLISHQTDGCYFSGVKILYFFMIWDKNTINQNYGRKKVGFFIKGFKILGNTDVIAT